MEKEVAEEIPFYTSNEQEVIESVVSHCSISKSCNHRDIAVEYEE